jgi:CHAD domain-containing protein
LKELAAVLTLVVSVKSTRKVEQAIDGLNKTEMMIGDWHDKEVLADSIEIYLEEATDITESQRVPVRDFHHQLIESNRTQIESIIQDVRTILMEGIPLKARGS